jgi:hypothetical protein
MTHLRTVDGRVRGSLTVLCMAVVLASSVVVQRRGEASGRSPGPAARLPGVASTAATSRIRRTPPRPAPTPRKVGRFGGSGDLVTVPGAGGVLGHGPLRRFTVDVEAGLDEDAAAFAAAVEGVLADARGWAPKLDISLQRVGSGPVAFRVTLASPDTTDRLCRPLRTGGIFSCFMRGRAVVNVARWWGGAEAYAGDVAAYRDYVVNHEVGHALGMGHRSCPGAGRPAPVMMQQTKGVGRCTPNGWPVVG